MDRFWKNLCAAQIFTVYTGDKAVKVREDLGEHGTVVFLRELRG